MAQNVPMDEFADSAKRAKDSIGSMSAMLSTMYATAKNLGASTEGMAKIHKAMEKDAKKQLQTEYAALNVLKQRGILDAAQLVIAKNKVKFMLEETTALRNQKAIINDISKMNELNITKARQAVELAKEEGKNLKASALAFKERFKNEKTGKVDTGHAIKGAADIAEDPKEAIKSLGVWGMIATMIADVYDGVTLLAADLQKASAESGNFATSVASSRRESMALYDSQISLMTKYGMTVKETAQIYGELKNTGIAALGVIPQTGTAMSDMALDVMSFAKATNQSTSEISEQYADMMRKFGKNEGDLSKVYGQIYATARNAAAEGIAKVSEMMKATFSLADAFSSVGMSIEGVNKVTNNVVKAMAALGRPGGVENVQRIAQGILGITKASEGWQVFMGKMNGAQGGYAKTLFSQQQRGADFKLPGKGGFDPMKTIQSFQSMIGKTTGGIGDANTRQLFTEKMGAQVGMDTETTQVMQKIQSGAMTQKAGAVELKKLHEAAVKNNMSSKGMFDILREILMGMIAKPILAIWKLLAKFPLMGGASDEDREHMDKMSEKIDTPPASAIGSDVTKSGLMMVHAGNKVSPAAKRTAYSGGGGGGGVNLSFNISIDEKSLHKKFMEMEKNTLEVIQKQQSANFG